MKRQWRLTTDELSGHCEDAIIERNEGVYVNIDGSALPMGRLWGIE